MRLFGYYLSRAPLELRPFRPEAARALAVAGLLGVARLVLISGLVIAPWCFGAVELRVQLFLYAALIIAFGCTLAAAALAAPGSTTAVRLSCPWALLPLVLALFLGAVQLLPLRSTMSVDSTLADVTAGIPADLTPATVSFYPAGTRLAMAQLVMAAIAFWLGSVLFPSGAAPGWLWGITAANGAALAFFGIVQKLTWKGELFWRVPSPSLTPFASFVNKNNAAGYLTLCLATGLGFAVWRTQRACGVDAPLYESTRLPRLRGQLRQSLAGLHPLHLFCALGLGLIVAGILCSLSRSGALALAAALLAAGVILLRVRRTAIVAGAGAVLILAVALVLSSGLQTVVKNRLATLSGESIWNDVRLPHWADALKAVREFPVLGTGLGTYRFVYLPFQTRFDPAWYYHAENQFVEAAVETGLIGLTLLLAGIASVGMAAWQLLSRERWQGAAFSCGFVAAIALAAQLVAGCFDFGLYIPATMLLMAVICGTAVGAAMHSANAANLPGVRIPQGFAVLILLALLMNAGVGLNEVAAAAATDHARQAVPALNSPEALNAPDVDQRIHNLEAALQRRWDDAEAQRTLAELWIYRYRLQTLRALEAAYPTADRAVHAQLWNLTQPSVLYGQVNAYFRSGDQAALTNLRNDPRVAENLTEATLPYQAARQACPVLPRVSLPLAMLAFLQTSEQPSGEVELRRAVRLSPAGPDLLLDAGALAYAAQLTDLWPQWWSQSLQLRPHQLTSMVALLTANADWQQFCAKVLADRPDLLYDLATDPQWNLSDSRRQIVLSQIDRVLQDSSDGSATAPAQFQRGRLQRLRGQNAAAVTSFEQAIALDPLQIDWHLELASAFRELGRWDDAHRELQICGRLHPEREDIRRALMEFHRARLREPSVGRQETKLTRTGDVK